jgi:hypothetical protein
MHENMSTLQGMEIGTYEPNDRKVLKVSAASDIMKD